MSSALVAQGIEHGSPKAGVAGSNTAGGTRIVVGQAMFLGPAGRVCISAASSRDPLAGVRWSANNLLVATCGPGPESAAQRRGPDRNRSARHRMRTPHRFGRRAGDTVQSSVLADLAYAIFRA